MIPKVHIHDEQFDGAPHPWCGRGTHAVTELEFEATPVKERCVICDREWFPSGQLEWHFQHAVKALASFKAK